jgi:hypothetical protein
MVLPCVCVDAVCSVPYSTIPSDEILSRSVCVYVCVVMCSRAAAFISVFCCAPVILCLPRSAIMLASFSCIHLLF